MPNRRIARINTLLQQEIDRYITRSFEPPQGVLITIEEVIASNDLSHAKVLVSVFPPSSAHVVLKDLQEQAKEIRYLLKKRLTLKMMPHIHFIADNREERAAHIYRILDDSGKTE